MRRAFTGVFIMGVLAAAAYLLYRALSRYQLSEISDALSSISIERLAAAGAFAAASYLCLTGFDALALRYVGKPLSYPRTALASFTALSIGHNIGLAALSSGAVRYRFYRRWGLSVEEVAKVIIFCGATVAIGLSTLGGAAALWQSQLAQKLSGLGQGAVLLLGGVLVSVPVVYLLMAASYRGRIGFRRWSMEAPPLRLAIGQVVIGTANFALVAGCLHQLLQAVKNVGYMEVASAYAIANATAIVSHVPGGLGVIESLVVFLIPGASVVAALIAFRALYFFVPLLFGGTMFLISEFAISRRPGRHEKRPPDVRGGQFSAVRRPNAATNSGMPT